MKTHPLLLVPLLSLFLLAPAFSSDEQIIAFGAQSDVADKLVNAFENMDEDYRPRTEHFLDNGQPTYINRLILEKSPYLLQHAHNPVNWYPFGDEAFSLAKSEGKPVFLSIGYATCHWCHVMERESFENEAIAKILNDDFIAIKVDREQLPDIDALYMNAVIMITGRGGWPMSNFLDTAGRPFHGGTYFPPDAFTDLLNQVANLWKTEEHTLTNLAGELNEALIQANAVGTAAREIGEQEIAGARELALSIHDDFKGGFGGAPKFPQEALLSFLLNEARLKNDRPSFNAVNYTLQQMAAGGIHDQIGGGFHRYAVDENWLVPHFEKMLYNQGLLARVFVQAYQLGGDSDHARTARSILDYVAREMTSPEGLFYSATDADSEGAEGTFFLWNEDSLGKLLSTDEIKIANALWGVTDEGNFEHQSILYRAKPLADLAAELSMSETQLQAARDAIAKKLLKKRDTRVRPILDDKVITAWNGLMISAFAEVGYALDEDRYIDIAVNAADKLWDSVHREDGSLWRTLYRGGNSVDGKQTDYAYLAESLLSLYDIDGDERWLTRAKIVTNTMIERFWDEENGGFYLGEAVVSGTALSIRPKDLHDSSIPSGNAVGLRALAKLYRRTGDEKYNDTANELIAAFSQNLAQQPSGFYYMLAATSDHLFEETGSHEYAARGVVKASGRKIDDNTVEVSITLRPGWHINSDQPTLDYLIATDLSSQIDAGVTDVQYPTPKLTKLGFESTELSLFEDTVVLTGTVDSSELDESSLPLQLRLQACSDEVCLAPETMNLLVSWVGE